MFTGLVEAVGTLATIEPRGGDRRVTLKTPAGFLRGVRIGDSIAVSGICLTVAALRAGRVAFDVSTETLTTTTMRSWRTGLSLNLEKSLTLAKPLGGHLVAGHVDGVGRLARRRKEARSWRLTFTVPRALDRYVARKGSVCIDGVSLTVNDVGRAGFGVNIVPHTLRHTTLGRLTPGDPVNVEVDLVARYLERLLPRK